MKEEVWSIRKMRELQKNSSTRNTYKQSEQTEYEKVNQVARKKEESGFGRFYQRLALFLEE